MISTMNKLELLATSLALGGCTLLSRSVPTEVRPILTPPIPTSEQVLRHFTDLNIQVLRGSDVNLEEQSLLELSKAYNSFLTASQKGELSYITSDPNNPLKTGALTESVAGALNIDAKNLPDGAINYALLPTEIKFGNQASVFYQPVLINAIDPSTGNQYQKVVMFGSSDGQNWGLVSFTQGSVNILSSQNAGVTIEGTNTVYTSFDKGSPPQITSILIAGGENGALFQSAMYVRGNNGEFELVLRDQEGTESGPLTNSDGLFEVSPPTDNQSPTPSPFKFDVSLVNYKIESPPKIETPTPTATATAKPTETPTPTEAPRMTLEDWKKVFTGPYTAQNGETYNDLGGIFNENVDILTDPDQVKTLPLGSPMMILNPDGTIIVYSDPDVAAERVEKGAIVLIDQSSPYPNVISKYALLAAARQYQDGNKNFSVQYNENSVGKFPFDGRYGISINLNEKVLQITLDDGTIITPIMAMPKHFEVRHAYVVEKSLTLEQAGIIITNPDNWLDQVLKAGYDAIVVYPW